MIATDQIFCENNLGLIFNQLNVRLSQKSCSFGYIFLINFALVVFSMGIFMKWPVPPLKKRPHSSAKRTLFCAL